MIEACQIADVLGGRPVLRRDVSSLNELDEVVSRGLPKISLRKTIARVLTDPKEQRTLLFRIIPEATFKRRRDKLSPAESERTERLARVVAMSEFVWRNADDSHDFLTVPHPMLRGKSPLSAALTEVGARRVEDVLARILHGLPA